MAVCSWRRGRIDHRDDQGNAIEDGKSRHRGQEGEIDESEIECVHDGHGQMETLICVCKTHVSVIAISIGLDAPCFGWMGVGGLECRSVGVLVEGG